MTEPLLLAWLAAATFLCTLTTGMLYAFWVVVMPGIRSMTDADFLSAFKAIDRVIQDHDWRFVVVWAGSILVLVGATLHAHARPEPLAFWLTASALVTWLLGVQLPTFAVNVPLNNRLQGRKVRAMDATELHAARTEFEHPWVYWNTFRTTWGIVTVILLLLAMGSLANS